MSLIRFAARVGGSGLRFAAGTTTSASTRLLTLTRESRIGSISRYSLAKISLGRGVRAVSLVQDTLKVCPAGASGGT